MFPFCQSLEESENVKMCLTWCTKNRMSFMYVYTRVNIKEFQEFEVPTIVR